MIDPRCDLLSRILTDIVAQLQVGADTDRASVPPASEPGPGGGLFDDGEEDEIRPDLEKLF